MRTLASFSLAIFLLTPFAANAACSKAATVALLDAVDNALFQERKLLWGAATNPRDDAARGAYLRQWGALGAGNGGSKADYLVTSPEGARTVLNGAMKGLRDYLSSCSE